MSGRSGLACGTVRAPSERRRRRGSVTEYPPGYQPPGYQPPGYQPAGYQPYGPPQYGEPQYGQPQYGQPGYDPPPYGQSPYGPQYGQPTYGQAPPGNWYPYPPNYGAGHGPPQRQLDGWSVAGLICGILPTVVFGVAFSVVGLVRTGNPLRRGRVFAVVGLLLSMVWLAVFVAAGALTDDPTQQPDAAPAIAAQDAYPLDLRVGDCFQQAPLTGQTTVSTVPKRPCEQSHNAMVVATVQPAYSTYPGLTALLDQAVTLCHPKAVSYLGRPLGRLRIAAFAPPETLWNLGYKQS
jgi:hypothetical protein